MASQYDDEYGSGHNPSHNDDLSWTRNARRDNQASGAGQREVRSDAQRHWNGNHRDKSPSSSPYRSEQDAGEPQREGQGTRRQSEGLYGVGRYPSQYGSQSSRPSHDASDNREHGQHEFDRYGAYGPNRDHEFPSTHESSEWRPSNNTGNPSDTALGPQRGDEHQQNALGSGAARPSPMGKNLGPDRYQDSQTQGHHHYDPDYHQWRQEQIQRLDQDYNDWRKERFQKFSTEFSDWRKNRDGAHSEQTEDVTAEINRNSAINAEHTAEEQAGTAEPTTIPPDSTHKSK